MAPLVEMSGNDPVQLRFSDVVGWFALGFGGVSWFTAVFSGF